MKNKKIMITAAAVSIIIIVSLAAGLFWTGRRLKMLEARLSYLSDTTDVTLNTIQNMKSDIETTLEKEYSILEFWDIRLVDTDFARQTYTVDISLMPKSYSDTTKVFIYFGTSEYSLENNNNSYTGRAELPLGEGFDGNVTVLIVEGKRKTTEILSAYRDVQQNFDDVLSGNLSEIPVYEEGHLKLGGTLEYVLAGRQFSFDRLDMVVKTGAAELERVDLLEEYRKTLRQDSDSMPWIINDTESVETLAEEPELNDFAGNISLNRAYAVEDGMEVHIYLEAVTKDGFRFDYDLFSGKMRKKETDGTETEEGLEPSDHYFSSNYRVFDARGGQYQKSK